MFYVGSNFDSLARTSGNTAQYSNEFLIWGGRKDIKKYIDRFNMFSIISEVLRVTAGVKEKAILRR